MLCSRRTAAISSISAALITAPVVFAIDMATRTLSATLYAERLPQGLRPYLTRRQWRWDGQRCSDIATKP